MRLVGYAQCVGLWLIRDKNSLTVNWETVIATLFHRPGQLHESCCVHYVEMMGFLDIGNNPMVGCTVACAVNVAQALKKSNLLISNNLKKAFLNWKALFILSIFESLQSTISDSPKTFLTFFTLSYHKP